MWQVIQTSIHSLTKLVSSATFYTHFDGTNSRHPGRGIPERMLVSLGLPARFAALLRADLRVEMGLKRENSPESEQSTIGPPSPGEASRKLRRDYHHCLVMWPREWFHVYIYEQILASAQVLLLRIS